MKPPVWLLDIDGVLNAASKKPVRSVWPRDQWIAGHAHDGRQSWPILAARPVAEFIREVHETQRAEIRWHTTWQQEARAVGKLLNLPDFPIADAPEWADALRLDQWWKIGAALRVVEDEGRRLVWTDDDAGDRWNLPAGIRERLEGRALIVAPSPYTGLTPKQLRQIDRFLTASQPPKEESGG